jgi:hypothetical protein
MDIIWIKGAKIETNLPNFTQHHLEASLTGGLQIGKRGTPMVAIHFTWIYDPTSEDYKYGVLPHSQHTKENHLIQRIGEALLHFEIQNRESERSVMECRAWW